MPDYKMKNGYILLLTAIYALTGLLFFENQMIGVVCLFVSVVLTALTVRFQVKTEQEWKEYVLGITKRFKHVSEEAVKEMPIGVLFFNDDYHIEWVNPHFESIVGFDAVMGQSLNQLSEQLIPAIKKAHSEEVITLDQRKWRVFIRPEEKILYFFDVTEQVKTQELYSQDRTALAFILIDNYDEITQGMSDQTKSLVMGKVTAVLNRWANEYGMFFKKISSDKFVAVMNQKIVDQLEKNKFAVLDAVRDVNHKQNIPLTLSIGVGAGEATLQELGHLAQSSLDLALGRGGDQVALKFSNGKVKFYGGKTNPIEKRTRVRARVISHALRELVLESDKVIIMGHCHPDMDAIGAAIGILKVAEANEKESYIILDPDDIHVGVYRLIDEVKKDEVLYSHFIYPKHALEECTPNTLVVVVDTHKPSLVIEPGLLSKTDRVVVIDHHRRGEEFIEDPVLVYMEPYASSTAELVTELLEYQPKKSKMSMLEASALLAGIIVDTKSFTLRTGSRTFDAASYLRANGADTVLVQQFLKEDLTQYVGRARLLEQTTILGDGIAIAKGTMRDAYDQVLIAQAADTLLTMNDVIASFVIAKRNDGKIGVSARSLGDVNVQVIMEKLNGGGHLTNAATQLENITIDETETLLKEKIIEYLEGGDSE